ncbi:MAG: sugar phosphate nucleotidyltransferase [Candidatus Altiarchaeota archaeon]|nr:sugar phosphate nucleotidyltransferase [Candidatus Altiarchaeota archaeon]
MGRERLTITLRDDMLKKVDGMVDNIRIRNRSHAIEVLLSRALSTRSISHAVLLAGGKGTRMRPFTYEIPKPMIPVQGRPLIQHLVELLRKYEVQEIVFSVGYMKDKIREYFGNGSKFGVNITYTEEDHELGTAGPLNFLKDKLTDTFLMLNGDVLANIDLKDFASFHKEKKGIATIALTGVPDPSRFGVARLKGDNILEFIEKPAPGKEPSSLINAGVYLLEPEVLKYIPAGRAMMEKDVFPKLAKKGLLYGYHFDGQWFDTGTPESYELAIKNWKGVI